MNKMESTKIYATIIVVVAVVLFFAGYFVYPLAHPKAKTSTLTSSITPGTIWQRIEKRGYITVATSPDWPPFEFIDPNTHQIVGYEVDLMNTIASKLGLKVKWKPMSFDAIISAVKNGEVDLGVSGFSVTPQRCNEVLFTMYHDVTEVQLIMLASRAKQLGISKFNSLDDIAKYHLIVGTGSGTTELQELLGLVKKGIISSSQVKTYPDFGAALKDLEAGRIDAVYAETPITTWWISTAPVKLVVVYSRPYWPVAFVANKNAIVLVQKINGVLAQMIANGELAKIKAKWNVTTPP